jgi:hypothetical protein
MRWSWMLVALAACGGKSYCEKSAEWFACGEEVEFTDEELADCEEALEPCSDEDQQNLIDATECLLGLFGFCDSTETSTDTPTTGELEDLAADAAECQAFSAAVSAECNAAVYGGGSTSFTSFTSSTY